MRPFKRKIEVRIALLFMAIFLFFIVIFYRLLCFQVIEAHSLEEKALSQRLKRVELPSRRGNIFDRDGEDLALSVEVVDINATPYLIKNPREVARKLAPYLGQSEEEIYRKLTRKTGFVYLAKKVDAEIAEKIKEMKIEGIGFIQNHRRVYPCNELAAQVIGFVGSENKGLEGLELKYDSVLKGKSGYFLVEEDPVGRPVPGGLMEGEKPKDGNCLRLTLDREIQHEAERVLREVVKQYEAKGATAIVIDPRNGEILAMASVPSFNLNHFTTATPDCMRNRAVTDSYEPGSTLKSAVAAACLEEKVYKTSSVIHVPAYLKVGKYRIGEAHYRPAGDYTLEEIIVHSYNVGAALLAKKLGKERVYNYLKSFGFGEKTGIDFPGESSGKLLKLEDWSKSTIYTVSYGQGISATPLQVLMMYATIANDGFWVQPHLVKEICDSQGNVVKEFTSSGERKVISTRTATEMRYILEKVVREGTGKAAAVPGYRVAGKTGTAKKPKVNGKGYSSKYVASFVGFAPAENPKLAAIVVVDEPKGAIYGGVVAAPAFSQIMEFSLKHLKIPPSEEQ